MVRAGSAEMMNRWTIADEPRFDRRQDTSIARRGGDGPPAGTTRIRFRRGFAEMMRHWTIADEPRFDRRQDTSIARRGGDGPPAGTTRMGISRRHALNDSIWTANRLRALRAGALRRD